MTNSIENNKPNSDIFLIGGAKSEVVSFPYKQIKKREGVGTLNAFQKSTLTENQKAIIKEDKKKLGGS